MTITPLFLCGAGFGRSDATGLTEFTNGYANACIASSVAHTGTYGIGIGNQGQGRYGGKSIPTTRQFRVGLWLYHNRGTSDPSVKANLLGWRTAASSLIGWVGVDATETNKLAAYVGGTGTSPVETSSATFNRQQWYHIGIDVKVHSSAGWIYVYQDGVEVIGFDGNTGDADIGEIVIGWLGGTEWQYGAADDYYIDDTAGASPEASPAVCPDRRIYVLYPNADGYYAEGKAKGGGSSGSAQVDDGYTSDLDSTYNYVDALNERETYNLTTFTPPSGMTIQMVQVKAHAMKTDASIDTEIALMQRGGATATDYEDAASQNLAGDWLLHSGDIRTLDPAGNPWDIAQIDSLQAGFRGKGTF